MGVADLQQIKPIVIAAYMEQMEAYASKPTIKQHRSAISKMFDWLVAGNVGLDVNPASAVKAPKPIVRIGKTPGNVPDPVRVPRIRRTARGWTARFSPNQTD